MINISDSYELWVIAQSRVCEVIVGILCGGLMMMILPSTSDGSNLLTALKTMHARLLEHASLLWVPETTDAIRTAHESVIGQILTMNLLRIQAFWSHYRFRRQNPLLNYLLHQQLRMTSVISSLRRMLLNWPDAPANTRQVLESLLAELATPHADSYHVARILAPLAPRQDADYRHIAFWARLRYFSRIYLESSRWIRRVENASAIAEFNVPAAPPLARHTDQAEALLNGVRTFCALVAIGAWGISTQWTSCAAALTLASICCVLYSVSASPFRSLTLLMQILVLLSLFSFVVKFGLMVQVTDLWQFLLFLFPLLTTMQLLKLQWPKYAGLWGQLIVFMGSFIAVTNPPVYDYAAFFNDNLSKIVGVGFAWLAFAVLSPGSDARKGRRHIRALRRHFVDQLSRHPQHSEHEFESLVYHHVSQLSQSKDALVRRWLLRWGVVLLNCSHVVWQLREWETRSDPLAQVRDLCINLLRDVMSERGVQQRPLASTLQELQRICDALNTIISRRRGNWPPRFGDCTAPCRSWNRPRWPAQLAKELLNHPAGKPFAAAAQRLRTVGHVIPAYVDHQRFPFHLRQRFQARSNNRLVGYARIVDHQQGQVAKMPGPQRPFVFAGMLRIVMSARRPGGHGFTFFHRRLAAAFGMNMKPVLTRR